MNGGNSNTSGSKVANIFFLPQTLLARFVEFLGGTITYLTDVINGNQQPASVDFSEKNPVDKLPDSTMEEIARRLIVTVESQTPGNVLFQPTEPADHTKAWWQTDPITGLPVGVLKIWDEDSGAWVAADVNQQGFVPRRRNGLLVAPAGISTQNFSFQDIGTLNYRIILTPTLSDGSGGWGAPPGSFPANFGFFIANKTNTIVTVAFYGIPTGGLRWEIDIEERPTA